MCPPGLFLSYTFSFFSYLYFHCQWVFIKDFDHLRVLLEFSPSMLRTSFVSLSLYFTLLYIFLFIPFLYCALFIDKKIQPSHLISSLGFNKFLHSYLAIQTRRLRCTDSNRKVPSQRCRKTLNDEKPSRKRECNVKPCVARYALWVLIIRYLTRNIITPIPPLTTSM